MFWCWGRRVDSVCIWLSWTPLSGFQLISHCPKPSGDDLLLGVSPNERDVKRAVTTTAELVLKKCLALCYFIWKISQVALSAVSSLFLSQHMFFACKYYMKRILDKFNGEQLRNTEIGHPVRIFAIPPYANVYRKWRDVHLLQFFGILFSHLRTNTCYLAMGHFGRTRLVIDPTSRFLNWSLCFNFMCPLTNVFWSFDPSGFRYLIWSDIGWCLRRRARVFKGINRRHICSGYWMEASLFFE